MPKFYSKKAVLIGLVAVGVTGLLGAVTVWSLLPGWIGDRIIREAAARGLYLRFEEVHASLDGVRLKQMEARPLQDRAWVLTAGEASVALTDWKPTSVSVQDATFESSSNVQELLESLGRSAKDAGQDAGNLPVSATNLNIRWSGELQLAAHAATASLRDGQLSAELAPLSVLGVELGPARITATNARYDLAFGLGSPADPPPLRVEATLVSEEKSQRIAGQARLEPLAVDKLPEGFRKLLPRAVDLESTVEFEVERTVSPSRVSAASARISTTLHGFVPPHPVELGGFNFGTATEVTSRVTYKASSDKLLIDQLSITAGALKLVGNGWVLPTGTLQSPAGTVHLELAGNLACAAVAQSAIQAHNKTIFGQWASAAARILTTGAVSVQIVVDSDLLAPDRARIRTGIGLGCGLQPLSVQRLKALSQEINLEDLPDLTDPDQLGEVFTLPDLPQPKGLPTIHWRLEQGQGGNQPSRLMDLPLRGTAPAAP